MNNFLKLNKDDMNTIINNVAVKKGISKSMIEKDYWACFILNFLLSKSSFKDLIAFKGGTSLSKCYGLINRFSEDLIYY